MKKIVLLLIVPGLFLFSSCADAIYGFSKGFVWGYENSELITEPTDSEDETDITEINLAENEDVTATEDDNRI